MNKHGGKRSRLYRVWIDMRRRCNNPNRTNYYLYGGRGIHVCNEWNNNFVPFRDWSNSHNYSDKLCIDRIDTNGDYSPDNCRWVTMSKNMRNTRVNKMITIFGETKTMRDWSEDIRCEANYSMLKDRITKHKWDIERAITQPRRNYPISKK